jgi:hypothetical protein
MLEPLGSTSSTKNNNNKLALPFHPTTKAEVMGKWHIMIKLFTQGYSAAITDHTHTED